jgi:hypothetical protein
MKSIILNRILIYNTYIGNGGLIFLEISLLISFKPFRIPGSHLAEMLGLWWDMPGAENPASDVIIAMEREPV